MNTQALPLKVSQRPAVPFLQGVYPASLKVANGSLTAAPTVFIVPPIPGRPDVPAFIPGITF